MNKFKQENISKRGHGYVLYTEPAYYSKMRSEVIEKMIVDSIGGDYKLVHSHKVENNLHRKSKQRVYLLLEATRYTKQQAREEARRAKQ
jgi:hypothetical protein